MPSEIRPSAQRLLAANGTQIPVLGCTTLNAQIGSQFIDIDGLVSEHVSDVMLGIDWLQANAVTWDFARSEILLNGQRFKLIAKQQGNRCADESFWLRTPSFRHAPRSTFQPSWSTTVWTLYHESSKKYGVPNLLQ